MPGTGSYYPFVSLSEGDKMTANFGESAFANSPPDGYSAFADGLVAGPSGDCQDPGPEGIPADPAPMTASCEGFSINLVPISRARCLSLVAREDVMIAIGTPVKRAVCLSVAST